MQYRFILALFLALMCSVLSYAQDFRPIENLYETIVYVDERDDVSRIQAIESAFVRVLQRITGMPSVSKLPEIQSIVSKSEGYVSEFGWDLIDVPSADGLGLTEIDALWVRFDNNLVSNLMNDLQLPIWPVLRPNHEFVVIGNLWNEPLFYTSEAFPGTINIVESLHEWRGIPSNPHKIATEEYRSIDRYRLLADEILKADEAELRELGLQSSHPLPLMVYRIIELAGESLRVDLMILDGRQRTVYSGSPTKELRSALSNALDSYVADLSFANSFLSGGINKERLVMTVLGLRDFVNYREVLNSIAELDQVTAIRLLKVYDTGMDFSIEYQSDKSSLQNSIQAATKLNFETQLNQSDKALVYSIDNLDMEILNQIRRTFQLRINPNIYNGKVGDESLLIR